MLQYNISSGLEGISLEYPTECIEIRAEYTSRLPYSSPLNPWGPWSCAPLIMEAADLPPSAASSPC